jgi:hypothetical protein
MLEDQEILTTNSFGHQNSFDKTFGTEYAY